MLGPLLDIPISTARKVVETNFFGFVRLVNEVVPRMAKREVPAGAPRGNSFHQCDDQLLTIRV